MRQILCLKANIIPRLALYEEQSVVATFTGPAIGPRAVPNESSPRVVPLRSYRVRLAFPNAVCPSGFLTEFASFQTLLSYFAH
jgi:hypothetical protein